MLGALTPMHEDCGRLCGAACCRGDENTGMRLFPGERTTLDVRPTEDGGRLAVCSGSCRREERPLACRIFPLFPTVDARGRVFVEPDDRAARLCPLLSCGEERVFDARFIRALRRVGRLLAREPACRAFMQQATQEIDTYRMLLRKE